MALKNMFLLLVGSLLLLVHVESSGVLPAVAPGIAYTRAIPYNVPPFAAAVSFLRTGPVGPVIAPAAALLPPHLHARYSPVAVAPHFHAAPVAAFSRFYPHLAPVGFAGAHGLHGVPAVLPHAASPVPHVGLVPTPHGHVAPVPHVHPYAAALPGVVPSPHLHAHAYAAPAVVPAPHVAHQALPHVHGHPAFAPLIARGVHYDGHDVLHQLK